MLKHNGMRPQDVVILLKVISFNEEQWLMKDVAQALSISASEVTESLKRSAYSGLLSSDKEKVNRLAFVEFLQYGLPYTFPARPGTMVRGIPTAHSAAPLNKLVSSSTNYVWPYAKGELRGLSIEPLHANVPEAALKDPDLHSLLALVDAVRVGRQREKQIAIQELRKHLL